MVKVGQRWLRIDAKCKYIVEIVRTGSNNPMETVVIIVYSEDKSVYTPGAKWYFQGDTFPKEEYNNEHWEYLEGQDAPC
jgi:hypothetical protein